MLRVPAFRPGIGGTAAVVAPKWLSREHDYAV
jgi:hypothetical protein